MGLALITTQQMIIMFILMMVGFTLFKLKVLDDRGASQLSGILIKLIIPAAIIHSLQRPFDKGDISNTLWTIGVTFLLMALCILVAKVLLPKKRGIDYYAVAFTNGGFIGLPLIQSVIGTKGVPYISIYMLLAVFAQFTYGRKLINGDAEGAKARDIIKSPGVIGPILGLFFYFTNFTLPGIIGQSVGHLANANTPVAMIVLGCYLAQSKLGDIFKSKRAYWVTTVRLVISTIACTLVIWLLPIHNHTVQLTLIIASACPVAANVAILGREFGGDYEYGARLVALCTIFSIVTVPLVVLLGESLLSIGF